MDLIKIAKEAFATDVKREMEFHPGDTITVAYKIIEGNKRAYPVVSWCCYPYQRSRQ